MLLIYESEDGLKLSVEHGGRGTPPRFIQEGGIRYTLAGEGYDPQADSIGLGLTVAAAPRPSLRDGFFESRQLPRWDPHHKGEFSKDGHPRFSSRREAREYAKRVSGETGLDCEHGQL